MPFGPLIAPPRGSVKLVIFGLAISSSWGNGHATLWRGLCRALANRGHLVVFFEHDRPYYASHRDMRALPDGRLYLYSTWDEAKRIATAELADASAAIVTSFCPDAVAAEDLLVTAPSCLRVFYDLDTPVTLDHLARGEPVAYLGPHLLHRFDLALSYTGGASLELLCERLGAAEALPLYGSVDPAVHQPVAPDVEYAAHLSYIGTYAADRQQRVDRLFLDTARQLPMRRFVLAGSQYPDVFPWSSNVFYKRHLPPEQHAVFYSSSRVTLNVTREAMATIGFCPSGRLFEAAACGTPIVSDWWPGLDQFFRPDEEIFVASSTSDVVDVIEADDDVLVQIGLNARRRTLAEHTADHRAAELERILAGRGVGSVGNYSGSRRGDADSAAGLFERAPARGQPL
jgi:spore maturation protein CgeB